MSELDNIDDIGENDQLTNVDTLGNAVQRFSAIAPAKVVANLDQNPDDGARAIQLSKSTGVPAPVVYTDLKGFDQQHKQSLASALVRANPYLSDYIRDNEMASIVSNDDYGNLTSIAEKGKYFGEQSKLNQALAAARGAAEGFKKGFGTERFGAWIDKDIPGFSERNPYSSFLWGLPLELPIRALNGTFGAVAGGVGGFAGEFVKQVTGDEMEGARAERDIAGAIDYHFMSGGGQGFANVAGRHAFNAQVNAMNRAAHYQRRQEAYLAAKPYLDSGLEPPRGTHEYLDQLNLKQNDLNIQRIDELLANVQESMTKERDPELFKKFLGPVVESSEIGISAEKINQIYGDSVVEPGKGPLGWVDGIAEKVEAARAFGEDVRIPLKDWLTRMDPAVAKEFHDDMRTWPGAITKNEAKVHNEIQQAAKAQNDAHDAAIKEYQELQDRRRAAIKGNPEVDALLKRSKELTDEQMILQRESNEIVVNDENYKDNSRYIELNNRISSLINEKNETTLRAHEIRKRLADEAVSPEQMQAARDKINGLSRVPFEPRPVIDSPMAKARDAMSTEPMFSIGDRKLELKAQPPMGDFHEFQIVDQTGKSVGELSILPDPATKQLYVGNINGLAGLYSNAFGPSLMRDLKRQLKEFYPEYETITGHRETGARKKAGTTGSEYESSSPVVRLHIDDLAHDDAAMRQMFDSAYMRQFDHGVEGLIIPKEEYARQEQQLIAAMREEAAKVAPGVEVIPTARVSHPKAGGATGVFLRGLRPQILVDMFSPDAKHVMRHEFMHHMKDLLRPEEWAALENAAKSEGWIERYNIEGRYGDILKDRPDLMLEEAIAEAYPDWHRAKDSIEQPKTLVTQAFQKIHDFIQRVKQRFAEILGHEPTFEELFEKISSGEIGQRSLKDRANQAFAEPTFSIKDRMNNLRAAAAGLDSKSFKTMQELIRKRHEEDLQAAIKQAEKEQAATQTKEWKKNAKEIRKAVDADIRQRPDVAVDLLVGSGEMQGQKLKQRYPLRADDLTDLQKSMLPRHYYAKDGLPVDGVANMFGFHSGDAMIDKLIEYRADKADMTAQERLAATIKEETDRRMEAQYGKLQDNIMSEAMDQALSETNLNILAEEWQGAAMKAKISVIDKDVAKTLTLEAFSKYKLSEVSLDRTIAAMGKFGRDAERKLIAGDHAGALVDMQRKYMTGLIAAEIRKLQKEQASFDRTAKQFSKREVPSVEPEYTNYIHDILMRVGKPVRRSIQDLEAQIAAGESKSLPDFVANKTAQLRELPVWEDLYDRSWRKDLKELTVEEFRAVNDSIKTLVHNGRDEMKLTRAGEAEDFAAIKKQMINSIAESANNEVKEPKAKGPVRKLPMQYYVQHLQMENILGRWDDFDSKGVWTQFVMRDLIDGANQVDAWRKEYAEKIKKLEQPENLNRTVDNKLFRDQDTGTMIPMTRKNLLAVMLNTGNNSNLVKMSKGYGLEPHQVMDWVHKHATPKDWKFVQGIWDIFADIKKKSDVMYRSLTGGVAPENVVIRPVMDAAGNKVADGGYYPIIFHPEMEGASKKLMGPNALEEQNYVRATPPAWYTKSRTGYVAPLALDLDAMPGRMSQMLHDIGLRPAVLNASKVFYDKDIRSAVKKFYGKEYRETLIPYLRGVANASNYMDKNQMALTRASEFIRQNMITTLVGLNPGTVMKHGPTALVLSIKEVGPVNFANAVKSLFSINDVTGESNWQFAIKNSLELQRRDRNWQETLYGATAGLTPGEKFEPWRQKIMEWSSKPVALSDMISAVPTWLAKYREQIEAGASHGDAVFEADRSVRRAHGSTAPTNRTAMQRNFSPWMTSIYNFWSEIMNRQMETIWRAGRAVDAVKEGDKAAAMAQGKYMIGAAFAFVIWPAIVENYVSPHPHKEDDGWAKKARTQLMYTLGSSWVGIRDLAAAFSFGRDPQFGLTGTTYQTMSNLWRDFNKQGVFTAENRGKLLQDGATLMGALTGMVPAQVGKAARFTHDVNTGKENPRNAWQWLVGLRYGTTDKHSQNFEQYMKGH